MSHLRPHHPETGQVKDVEDYSPEEKSSALMQTTDAALARIAQKKPIDKGTAELMVELAAGTDKEGTLPTEVVDAATAPAKGAKSKKGDEAE